MITKFLHKTMLLAALCLSGIGCSDETSPQQAVPESDGQVKILYKIAGPSLSRAKTTPEPGWPEDWHENLITRVDLFVFTAEGQYYDHIEASAGQDQFLSDTDQDIYTPLVTDELTYEEVSEGSYTYYMVANCPQLAGSENITLAQLQQVMINTAIVWNDEQEFFVMDGIGERTDTNEGQTITLTFDLARAAVKVLLSVVDETGTDITSQCSYRFHNYVLNGTSVLAESEKYGAGTGQSRGSMTETEAVSFTPLRYDDADEGIHQVVFYSYPNDWFDTSKLEGQTGAWTIQDYASQDPIVDANQTYILLTAPYEGENYHYKIPINFAIYENNDKVSFTDAELEEIRDLYRMKRNHIYSITAQINRRGGGLDLETQVHEWVDGGGIDINYADNYAGDLNVITQTPVTTDDNEAYAVVYGDNDKVATFTFRMTHPAGATWTANLTNGSQFELTSASGIASGVGVGETEDPNEGLVTFSVRPTQEYEPGTNPETELYITVINANSESLGEQIINPNEEYPGTTTRIKIRQVSLDQWNEYNNN